MRMPWLLTALVLAGVLLALHLYALATFFYWHHLWFDIPMHILGGAALAALIIAVVGFRPWIFLFGMLVVVGGWELFENYAHISTGQLDYWFDTSYDMINGLVGAMAVFVVALLEQRKLHG